MSSQFFQSGENIEKITFSSLDPSIMPQVKSEFTSNSHYDTSLISNVKRLLTCTGIY
jgi:hypothetical protein